MKVFSLQNVCQFMWYVSVLVMTGTKTPSHVRGNLLGIYMHVFRINIHACKYEYIDGQIMKLRVK
jgi:hypothetical protein